MKVYIAGKITGYPGYKDRFLAGKVALEQEGHIVLNPADLPAGMTNSDYMRICFSMIDVADAVAFLSGWELSDGARLERAYCDYIGKPTMLVDTHSIYKNLKYKVVFK